MAKNYTLRFRKPDRSIFEAIRSGKKPIETRAATVKYRNIAIGDTVTFVCGTERFQKTITNVYRWRSLDAMLHEVPLAKVMPHASNGDEAKQVYASFPGYEAKIAEHGLVGFEMA